MPVPAEVYWGPNDDGASLHYGEMRAITDDDVRVRMLRKRLETLFNAQVEPLFEKRSGFPLVVMTCIGIETLGLAFHSNEENQGGPFIKACGGLHQKFNRKFSADFEAGLRSLWGENKEMNKITTLSELFYKYLRNEMVHGYQARGVYLSYEDTTSLDVKEKEGYVVLNPGWFWTSYKDLFNKYFYEQVGRRPLLRTNCLKYIDGLLK
jgi:hypothetical protein